MESIKIVKKVWGEEHWIVNEAYCGKLLKLKKMHRCSIHHHEKKTETFFVIKGQVVLELNDEAYMLLPGCAVDVRPGERHRFSGIEDSEIIEFSTHHEDTDSFRLTASGKIENIEELNRAIHKTRTSGDRVRRA